MNRALIAVLVAATVALSGCAALPGGGTTAAPAGTDEPVDVDDTDPGASSVNHSLAITVNESTNDSELESIGATYPRENFTVDSAKHEAIEIGVDTDGDGAVDRELNATHVSGVNNNAYSYTIELDTDYTLETGDVVVLEYPAVDNPEEPGEYEVEVHLNDDQTTTGNVTID